MKKEDIKISFIGMEPTEALKEYSLEKIMKKETLLKDATSIEIFLKENKYTKGVQHDFRIDINVNLPKSSVRVEQSGPDMYANIDAASDTLTRRITRYLDKRANWEGENPWKILEAEAALEALTSEVEDLDDYSDYIPNVTTRKSIKNLEQMEEGEAIERMELSGYDQYLFRNKRAGNISMVYKRKQGGYGLVETE